MKVKNIQELKQDLGKLYDEARAIIELCDTEQRAITVDEEKQYDDILTRMDALKAEIARREKLEGFTGVSKPQPQQRNGQFASSRAIKRTRIRKSSRPSHEPDSIWNGLWKECRHRGQRCGGGQPHALGGYAVCRWIFERRRQDQARRHCQRSHS